MSNSELQIVVAEIDQAASAIAECYEQLPASAKASTIRLGHALSELRCRITAKEFRSNSVQFCRLTIPSAGGGCAAP